MGASRKITVIAAALSCAVMAACSATDGSDPNGGRSMIGAGLDALANLTGRDRQQRSDELINAGVDAVGQSEANPYMDGQEKELREALDERAKVTRAGSQIVVTIPSGDLFDSNRDALRKSGSGVLGPVAAVLKKFDRTTVDVFGHTDTRGDEKKNFDLTQRRALAVAKFFAGQGIDTRRLSVTGFGGSRPSNPAETDEARQENRRIEIQISPVTKGKKR